MPVLGFAFDASLGAIRPIVGITGAAILGNPLDSGSTLESAVIAPHQDFALAVSAEDGFVRIIRFQDKGASVVQLTAGMSSPDRIVFSPSGLAALLFRQDSGRIQILTGLPDASVIRELSIAGGKAPAALSLTDDGNLVLLGGQDSEPSWAVDSLGNFVPLALPASTMAVGFRHGSHDLLSVTRAGDLFLARNVDGLRTFVRIDTFGTVVSEPIAVQFSLDGDTAYVLGADGNVMAVELASGSSQTVSCGCKPTALEPLRQDNMFRLTAISGRPLMLFGASSGLHVWFVPTDPGPVKSLETHR